MYYLFFMKVYVIWILFNCLLELVDSCTLGNPIFYLTYINIDNLVFSYPIFSFQSKFYFYFLPNMFPILRKIKKIKRR